MKHKTNYIAGALLIALSATLSNTVIAARKQPMDSAHLVKPRQDNPRKQETYVDTKPENCTSPRQSSPYVIVGGAGGTNMHLTCPPDKPVMYKWNMQLGFTPVPPVFAVVGGGGQANIICCPVKSKWVNVKNNH